MAIYTRWGEPIQLTANCGTQEPKEFVSPVTLIQYNYLDEPNVPRYYFSEFLRADDGWKEIETETAKLPNLELAANVLQAAIQQAL